MKQIILSFIIGILLIGIISAGALDSKPFDSKDQLDFKEKIYTITETGIYDDNLIKQKSETEAEVWIEKKIDNVYYVDSLVPEPIKIKIELFYDVQPDTITFKSHSGATEKIYTPSDWIWKDKSCAEYCGGYVTFEVEGLEYALGSNTFTSAISGATWVTDGISVEVPSTSYTLTGNQFTITDDNYAWNNITVDYNVTQNASSSTMINSFYSGLSSSFSTIITALGIIAVVVLVGFVIMLVKNSDFLGNGSL